MQAATRTLIGKLSDADLDAPAPEHFRSMFPTVGHIVVLLTTHPLDARRAVCAGAKGAWQAGGDLSPVVI